MRIAAILLRPGPRALSWRKRSFPARLALIALAAIAALGGPASAARRVAVLDLEISDISGPGLDRVQDQIVQVLTKRGGYDIIDAQRTRRLAVMERGTSKSCDEQCAKNVAIRTNADFVLTGSMRRHPAGPRLELTLQIVHGSDSPQRAVVIMKDLSELPGRLEVALTRVFRWDEVAILVGHPAASPPAPAPLQPVSVFPPSSSSASSPTPAPAPPTEDSPVPEQSEAAPTTIDWGGGSAGADQSLVGVLVRASGSDGKLATRVTAMGKAVAEALGHGAHLRVLAGKALDALGDPPVSDQANDCAEDQACLTALGRSIGAAYLAVVGVDRAGSPPGITLVGLDPRRSTIVLRDKVSAGDPTMLPAAANHFVERFLAAIAPAPAPQPHVDEAPPPLPQLKEFPDCPGCVARGSSALGAEGLEPHELPRGRRAGIAALAIGAAALIAGSVLGLTVRSDSSVLISAAPAGSIQGRINSINARGHAADALWLAGGVIAAAGVGLTVGFP